MLVDPGVRNRKYEESVIVQRYRKADRSELPSPGVRQVQIRFSKWKKIRRRGWPGLSKGWGDERGWYIADQYNCTLVLINNRR